LIYASPRLPGSISQTIERSDLSLDLILSYQMRFIYHSHVYTPFVKVDVTARGSPRVDDIVSLYSRTYYGGSGTEQSYDITVNLKADSQILVPERITITIESGYENRLPGAIQTQLYIRRVSLVMIPTPPPPPPITATVTITITETEAAVVTHTIRQRTPVMSIERMYLLLLMTALVVGVTASAVVYLYSRRRSTVRCSK